MQIVYDAYEHVMYAKWRFDLLFTLILYTQYVKIPVFDMKCMLQKVIIKPTYVIECLCKIGTKTI